MMPWLDVTVTIFTLVGLIIAWLATIIPAFPAPTLMWLLILMYGVATGFETRGVIFFVFITLLTIASLLIDNVFSMAGARKGGARWWSIAIAGVVGLVASLLLTPIGGILLWALALFLSEYYFQKDATLAWEATKSMVIGWGWAAVARLGIGLVVLGLWAAWAFL
jgi:uncharacterized protein YqgC (DUF456 family)